MNVAITGASGFIGRAVAEHLRRSGHIVRAVSLRAALPPDALAGVNAVIHLAGEPVAQRWTASARDKILRSRVEGTEILVAAMRAQPPQVLVSASAVGYYGSRGDEILIESAPPAQDFLGRVATAWEEAAQAAEPLGVRVARIRIGMVLGKGGGALARMLLPFRLGVGGRLGSGKQWMSWIHIDDLIRLIVFLMKESTVRGVFNATSPFPVTNREFTRALAEAVHRPAIIPVPAFALRLALGEMAEVLLASQRAIPDAAQRAGFVFEHPDIFTALAQVAGNA
ncbi:MAG TPA: TIGR01777 family oxidoreductase [Bryobacteraceae bacterium]|nr:TIGR01777 family oxidoreductase [Bryobacteraceae bacterium]